MKINMFLCMTFLLLQIKSNCSFFILNTLNIWWCLDWNEPSIKFYKKMGAILMNEIYPLLDLYVTNINLSYIIYQM